MGIPNPFKRREETPEQQETGGEALENELTQRENEEKMQRYKEAGREMPKKTLNKDTGIMARTSQGISSYQKIDKKFRKIKDSRPGAKMIHGKRTTRGKTVYIQAQGQPPVNMRPQQSVFEDKYSSLFETRQHPALTQTKFEKGISFGMNDTRLGSLLDSRHVLRKKRK